MKKIPDLDKAKQQVHQLVGKQVVLKLNRGRNRVKCFKGVLSQAHSNVFVVRLAGELFDRITCSYTDILCGEASLEVCHTP